MKTFSLRTRIAIDRSIATSRFVVYEGSQSRLAFEKFSSVQLFK